MIFSYILHIFANYLCIFIHPQMKNKVNRLEVIRETIHNSTIRNQDELLHALTAKGFSLTQATLSRDLKQLKVAKQATEMGDYAYILPAEINQDLYLSEIKKESNAFLSIDFSGNMAVIKTKPGYASSIASDIDSNAFPQFLGSIAGDDTVLLIVREGISKEQVLDVLAPIFQ